MTRARKPPPMPRLTATEWAAVHAALQFALAGIDPWEDEVADRDEEGAIEDSPTRRACRSAAAKVAARTAR
jgi:hypothetical protein